MRSIGKKELPLILTVLITAVFLLSGTGHTQTGDILHLEELKEDIETVSLQIAKAEKENARYAGGLVKTLIILRLQILNNTKAMLEQKKYALIHGIPVHYTYRDEIYIPTPADSATIQIIESDIKVQQKRLAKAEAEDEKYSGGLVKAMIASQICTIKNTIAMLEQKKMIAKYGIPIPALQVEKPTAKSSAEPSPPATSELEIVDVQTRVTESNPSWWKYAWRLIIRNQSSSAIVFDAIIEWQDEEGFVIDDDTQYGLHIPAGEQKTFTGYQLIDASVAGNVAKVGIKVRHR